MRTPIDPDPGPAGPHDDGYHSLMDMFDELSFREKWAKVFHGLRQPRESGEHKWARLQLVRLAAPISAIVVPLLLVLLLMTIVVTQEPHRGFDVEFPDPEPFVELDEANRVHPEAIEPPDPTAFEMPDENIRDITADIQAPSPDYNMQEVKLDSVSITHSPSLVAMRHMLSSRNPGMRESALTRHGGSEHTERAVELALRWLKKNQDADGSWQSSSGGGPQQHGGSKPAMTGLALLAYLAHGLTPASREFGPTIERAIRWMVENQTEDGHFKGADGHDYCQPIAAYALSEAYAMTRNPLLKEPAERSATRIVKGQNKEGLWNYNFNPRASLPQDNPAAERQDLSYAAWCIQALKAASLANVNVEGLDLAMRRAVEGIHKQGQAQGQGARAFGYSRASGGPNGPWEITGAGLLALQLLGQGKTREANEAQRWLRQATCDWEKPWSTNPIYHWYYVTQAKFHEGGAIWNDWNKQFSPQLVKNQVVIKNAIEDPMGNLTDIGFWNVAADSEYSKSLVYNTALCALMLQVYYRYLPTYQTPEAVASDPSTLEDTDLDLDIQIKSLDRAIDAARSEIAPYRG